jgi:hypothetical protein
MERGYSEIIQESRSDPWLVDPWLVERGYSEIIQESRSDPWLV